MRERCLRCVVVPYDPTMQQQSPRDNLCSASPPRPWHEGRSSSVPAGHRRCQVDAEKRLSPMDATRLMLAKWDALDRESDSRGQQRGPLPLTHVDSFERWAPEWELARLAQIQMEARIEIEKQRVTPPGWQLRGPAIGAGRAPTGQLTRRIGSLDTGQSTKSTPAAASFVITPPRAQGDPRIVPYEKAVGRGSTQQSRDKPDGDHRYGCLLDWLAAEQPRPDHVREMTAAARLSARGDELVDV